MLTEFRDARKAYMERVLSSEQLDSLDSDGAFSGELFEGFGSDFVELRGHCVLIPAAHNFNHLSRTDNIIKWLDPMLSREFERSHTFETKLAILFNIKEKWTLSELDIMLKETLEPEQNLASLLMRSARTLKETNPFNAAKITIFYIKKF